MSKRPTSKRVNGSTPAPVRIFVGASAGGEDAEACLVCEASLRRRTSLPIEVEWLALSRDPASSLYSDPKTEAGWQTARWATPWTALRWAVPALCGWTGRAIYLDCTSIVLGDVAELAAAEFPPGAAVLMRRTGRTLHTGCAVWNCATARVFLPHLAVQAADVGAHQAACAALADRSDLVGELPPGWGLTDLEYSRSPDEATGSVNCVNLYMQPHARYALPRLRRAGRDHWFGAVRMRHFCDELVALFDRELRAARDAGSAVEHYLAKEPFGPYAIRGADRAAEDAR